MRLAANDTLQLTPTDPREPPCLRAREAAGAHVQRADLKQSILDDPYCGPIREQGSCRGGFSALRGAAESLCSITAIELQQPGVGTAGGGRPGELGLPPSG